MNIGDKLETRYSRRGISPGIILGYLKNTKIEKLIMLADNGIHTLTLPQYRKKRQELVDLLNKREDVIQ